MITLLIQDTTQALQDTANAVNQAVTQPQPELHFIDLLFKGGWVMVPLAFLAVDCCPLDDCGNKSFTTVGFTTADANKKNNIRKNIISFNAEVCTSTDPFVLLRKFIICLALLINL